MIDVGSEVWRLVLASAASIVVGAAPGIQVAAGNEPGQVEPEPARVYIPSTLQKARVRGAVTVQWTGAITATINHAMGLGVYGAHAYVGDPVDRALVVVDVSDPTAPFEVARLGPLSGIPARIVADGRRAYVAVWRCSASDVGQVYIVDVATPSAPAVVGTLPAGHDPGAVLVADDSVWVADNDVGICGRGPVSDRIPTELTRYNVADPATPREISRLGLPDAVTGLATKGGVLFATQLGVGLTTIDLSSVEVLATLPATASGFDVAVRGGLGYVVSLRGAFDDLLHVVDIADPRQPTVVGRYGEPEDLGPAGWRIVLSGNYALVLGSDTVRVLDVRDSRRPTLAYATDRWERDGFGDISDIDGLWDMAVYGEHFLVTDTHGLWIARIVEEGDPDPVAQRASRRQH